MIRVEWLPGVCGTCAKEFVISPTAMRSRLKNNKSKKVFCSLHCAVKYQRKMEKVND